MSSIPEVQTFTPTVLDLFCGAGGTALGFQQAGFKIVGAVDIDKPAAITYTRNIGVAPLVRDLHTLSAEEIMDECHLEQGELDVLVGCPPCQGFTRMRNGDGADDTRNRLVLRYLEFVEDLQPKCVVFENVPGIRKGHGLEFYTALCTGLARLGYAYQDRQLNAVDFGVPQFRKRVVLLAGREQQCIPFPEPSHAKPDTMDVAAGLLKPWVTVWHTLQGLPELEAGESHADIPNHSAREMKERVRQFIELVPIDGGSRTDVDYDRWLPCHKKEKCGHKDVYGRLSSQNPSGVITSGCTNVSKGRFVHPYQHRGLSSREAARLQSFPDTFAFEGGFDTVAKQIGNAVPPLMAKAIAQSIGDWLRQN